MQSITPYLNDVYLWEGDDVPPASLMYGGLLLERFMDRIYIPGPVERLQPEQIALVNSLRRTLMLRDEVGEANAVVKRLFAGVIKSAGVGCLLEWGCGYNSIEACIPPSVSLSCVDLDPQVVKWQSARGCRCFNVSDTLEPACFDAIVAIFVFHFRVASAHIAAMVNALRPSGFLLANVYRRDPASRLALQAEFRQHGLTVVSVDDPLKLCARHEYWAMSQTRSAADLMGLLEQAQVIMPPRGGCAGRGLRIRGGVRVGR